MLLDDLNRKGLVVECHQTEIDTYIKSDDFIIGMNTTKPNYASIDTVVINGNKQVVELVSSIIQRYNLTNITEATALSKNQKAQRLKVKVSYHDILNPDIWIKNSNFFEMRPEVQNRLMMLADEFVDFLDIGINIKDIIITGSSANFNWTADSDLDVHVLVDFKKETSKHGSLLDKYVAAKSRLWNELHDINIRTTPIEIYVQDISEEHNSTGMYSILNKKWICKPRHEKPNVNMTDVKVKLAEWIDKIEAVLQSNKQKSDRVDAIFLKLKKFRKAGLSDGGEFSVENLVFKALRQQGYLERLDNARLTHTDDRLSV